MATTLSTAARNAACNAIVDLVDVGGAGKIRIKSAGATVIAEVSFDSTAVGAASTGVATAASTPLAGAGITAASTGTDATTFDVCQNDNTVLWSGAVGNGSGELDLDNVNIADGQVVTINSITFTVPAS
jgi:hypothetical protein